MDDVVKDKKREEDNKYQQANEAYNNKISQGKPATLPTVAKKEEDIKQEVTDKLGNILYPKNTAFQYADLDPGKETTDLAIQKQWVTAIYNYQIKKNVTYQKIADKGSENNQCNLPIPIFGGCLWPFGQNNDTSDGVNEKDSDLYKKLKGDIKPIK